jgi:hypothetical protein
LQVALVQFHDLCNEFKIPSADKIYVQQPL